MARKDGEPKRSFGTIRQLSSGRHQARYTGPDLRRYKAEQTFATEDDAKAWLRRIHREIRDGLWSPPGLQKQSRAGITLKEYADDWLKHRIVRGRPLKQRTKDHYRDLLDNHILPELGSMPLKSITRDDVREWYDITLLGRPTYRSHAYSLLRTILSSAEDEERILVNPAKIHGAGAVDPAHHASPATLEELGIIVGEMPDRLKLMTQLAAWCALRFGELTELRRMDVILAKDQVVLHVRRGVVRTKSGRQTTTPKSRAGIRRVNVPPHLHDAVRAHLRDHTKPKRDALLFPADHGGHLAPSTLYRHYYRARKAAGREDLRFHDLRVTGATMAAHAGATLKELQARLGHTTAAAAMRYQRAVENRDVQLARKLSAMVDLRTRGETDPRQPGPNDR
ncbi:tyrosine-type recombinase/integrase [Nocardia transvalensis]|uniref:tyrosine-type recombinase/integrase n=1 Tax=Nocardia transvalensis TaxID=37333 RepID=UPI001892EDF1|nr:site-specific integrase [Nocardia transvalensis]MBF6329776.1 tyrosine-type recombinase/integrase family protein [Nocardia transvalensis]